MVANVQPASTEPQQLDVDKIKLFSGTHAIEDATFGIAFSEPLTAADYQRFNERIEDVKGEFALINEIPGVELSLDGDFPTLNAMSGGKHLAHYAPDGRVLWAGQFSGNSVKVSAKTYTRWAPIWSEAKRKLKLLLDLVDTKKFVVSVDLLVTDSFSVLAPQRIRPADLFSSESKYFGEQIFKIEDGRWDTQIGWFEPFNDLYDKLVRFDTRAVRRNQEYVVTIVNLLSIRPSGNSEALEQLIQGDLSRLEAVIQEFHADNKRLLKRALKENISKRMGL